ncbi:hypothetical protein PGT21_021743 [Puccinia graminis f. sp. tritici]|uniref:Uncharacterized protein n=1 Tax=Puccinia graminis f. sp. tritici TaxID=56615 RepID=A0A5B0QTN8_PUCGR|nr:hypothetical protein PGT21_021743 [Puccinia graminis f. sp. tritici]
MFSSNSTLSFSSTELNSSHLNHYSRAPFRPRNHPKSRSKLHHHHQHQHDHHPSWSSSLSAFSLQQQQRASGFLIDEYGNEHDPEHCRFKTLATVRQLRRHSRSSSSTSTSSDASLRSRSSSSSSSTSSSSRTSSSDSSGSTSTRASQPHSPSSSSHWTRSSPQALPNLVVHSSYHSLPPSAAAAAAAPSTRLSCWSSLKPRPKKLSSSSPATTASSSRGSRSSWTRTLWAHLRPSSSSSSPAPSSPPVSYALHQAAHPIFSLPTHPAPAKPPAHLPFLTRFHLSPASEHPHHLSAVRKRLELVKLEVRFGILRTRKRLVGAWKQQTGCKKL